MEIAASTAVLEAVSEVACKRVDLASVEFRPLLSGADLVTASALFDLFSVEAIERLAGAVAAERCAFYTVFTYDGIAAFLPEHSADGAMRETFNRHQRTDKGFGPAAGPTASDALAAAFARYGYSVLRGKSPWVLDDAPIASCGESWSADGRRPYARPVSFRLPQSTSGWLTEMLPSRR